MATSRRSVGELRAQLGEFAGWEGARGPTSPMSLRSHGCRGGGLVLATWRPLLEPTVMQQGEPYLAATARPQEVWLLRERSLASLRPTEGQPDDRDQQTAVASLRRW